MTVSATRCSTSRAVTSSTSRHLDADHDGWPEGNGNVERPGMGAEKLDNAVYYIRGLYDYADMARSAGQTAQADAAEARADDLVSRFDDTWWIEADQQYGDSLDPNNVQINQKHWIGVTPMEVELYVDGEFVPGVARVRPRQRGARHAREQLLQRRAARQPRPLPYGLRRRADRRRRVRDLLARHRHPGRRRGQLRPPRRRAAAALHGRQRRDPVLRAGDRRHARRAAGRDARDLPVLAARRDRLGHAAEHRPLLDLPVDVHAGLGPLRHGVGGRAPAARRATAPRSRLPRGRPAAAAGAAERGGADIRLGRGSTDVHASRAGGTYTTKTDTMGAPA